MRLVPGVVNGTGSRIPVLSLLSESRKEMATVTSCTSEGRLGAKEISTIPCTHPETGIVIPVPARRSVIRISPGSRAWARPMQNRRVSPHVQAIQNRRRRVVVLERTIESSSPWIAGEWDIHGTDVLYPEEADVLGSDNRQSSVIQVSRTERMQGDLCLAWRM